MICQEHCLIIQEMIFFLQEASSSSATAADSSLFPIASSGDTTKHSDKDVTADSERPGTSGATVTTTEGFVCTYNKTPKSLNLITAPMKVTFY